jgi:drug/metabolite transporter (DMT)-like permease
VRRVTAADLMLLAVVVLWGFNVVVTRYLLTHGFRPLAYASLRYGIGAVVFAAIVRAREGGIGVPRADWPLVGLAAVCLWVNQLVFNTGLSLSTAATASLILGFVPVATGVIAWIVGFERQSRRFWLSAAVASGGVALVALGSGGGVSGHVGGDLLLIATAVSWAGYTVSVAPLMERHSPLRVSAIVFLVCLPPLFATAGYQFPQQRFSLGWAVWGAFAFAVIVPLVATNMLWFTAIMRVGPSRAALVLSLQPFIGAVAALLLLGEPLGALQVVGGCVIAGAILGTRLRRRTAVGLAER